MLSEDNYFQHTRPEMLKFIPVSAYKILEIGCGNGAFGHLIKERQHCEYWGIEINTHCSEIAKEKLDVVLNKNIEEYNDLPKKSFDCIIFNDVLEHLIEPEAFLTICKKLLKSGGVIVSSIPNIRHAPYLYRLFYLGEFTYESSGIMDKTHLRFFTRKSILQMYKSLGFEIIKHEGINESISLKFKILIRFLNLLTNKKFEDTRFQQFASVVKYA